MRKATGISHHPTRPSFGAIHESPLQHIDHGEMDRITVGAIHELPPSHIEDGQTGQIAVGGVHESSLPGAPRKELAFFLLPVPPSVPTVGELK